MFLRMIYERSAFVELCDSCRTILRATTWPMADVMPSLNGSTLPKDS